MKRLWRWFAAGVVAAALLVGPGAGVALAHPTLLFTEPATQSAVASSPEVPDRNAAEALRGARIFIAREHFPQAEDGEYYWVDLLGLAVTNREGVSLGVVRDLLSTGPQTVLVLGYEEDGKQCERLIPFVDAYVDKVDLQAKVIVADWQPDY